MKQQHSPTPYKASYDQRLEIFADNGKPIAEIYRLESIPFEADAAFIVKACQFSPRTCSRAKMGARVC